MQKYTIGIDEVGRGPIAGPVGVGAFIFLTSPFTKENKKIFKGVRESKQLTPEKREIWFKKIAHARSLGYVDYVVTLVNERIIDEKGIQFSIRSALKKSLMLIVRSHAIETESCTILLDGGLRAPEIFTDQKTIIKGDCKEQSIALASICAKVLRDRYMRTCAKKYPLFGFETHKGYGTRRHYKAILKHGLSPLHRKTFLSKIL